MLGWQEFSDVSPDGVSRIPNDDLLSAHLGPLGGTGLTAYFGLVRHGRPEPGDTLVVSGAAGATGSVVGQIGKIMGCRVIGIAGGADKCDWLVSELGFDDAIDSDSDDFELGPDADDEDDSIAADSESDFRNTNRFPWLISIGSLPGMH